MTALSLGAAVSEASPRVSKAHFEEDQETTRNTT